MQIINEKTICNQSWQLRKQNSHDNVLYINSDEIVLVDHDIIGFHNERLSEKYVAREIRRFAEQSSCGFAVVFIQLSDALLEKQIQINLLKTRNAVREGDFVVRIQREKIAVFHKGEIGLAAMQRVCAKHSEIWDGEAKLLACAVDKDDCQEICMLRNVGSKHKEMRYGEISYIGFSKAMQAPMPRKKGNFSLRHAERFHQHISAGMKKDAFELHYQKQCVVGDASAFGYEALLRWKHPEHGLLHPGAFIGFANRSELGGELALLALSKMLQDINLYQQQILLPNQKDMPCFSFNLSPQQSAR